MKVLYRPGFVTAIDRDSLLREIEHLQPLWEWRYSTRRPPPTGESQRRLLRPVYWLGNWQFACLDYYRPPNGIKNRCVRAEPFSPVLRKLVTEIEMLARATYTGADLPPRWRLNTCLVNFYGSEITPDGKKRDTARVGEHKDFEPGPVASLSFGERALFQFVKSHGKGSRTGVVLQQWLEDRSLQLFGGSRWKRELFHRVQRVETKGGYALGPKIEGFETRRINLTFRYVPEDDWVDYAALPELEREDVREYVETLARHSTHWAREREAALANPKPPR